MEISLSFEKDGDILKSAFDRQLAILIKKGLQTEMRTDAAATGFRFLFTLREINDNWFLLPLHLAKAISLYTTEHRERFFLEEILQKYYFFLDTEIKRDTRRFLEKERLKKSEREQRQMLLFFPIINYFSRHLPTVTWNYEGFLLFRSHGYWASLDHLVASCAENAFLAEERKYQALLYPPLHREKNKKETSSPQKDKR